MKKPIQICYCQIYTYPGNPEKQPVVLRSIDIEEHGKFNYQQNQISGPQFIAGVTSVPILQELYARIPKGIFDPDLPAICRAKFVLPTAEFRNEVESASSVTQIEENMHLSIRYSDPESGGEILKETTLAWDAQKTFLDFPIEILQMQLAFHKIFNEFKDTVEQPVLDPCILSVIDKLA